MGYENWTLAIGGWIDEKEHYVYGHPATGVVGHYTQVCTVRGADIAASITALIDDLALGGTCWLRSNTLSCLRIISDGLAFLRV